MLTKAYTCSFKFHGDDVERQGRPGHRAQETHSFSLTFLINILLYSMRESLSEDGRIGYLL